MKKILAVGSEPARVVVLLGEFVLGMMVRNSEVMVLKEMLNRGERATRKLHNSIEYNGLLLAFFCGV